MNHQVQIPGFEGRDVRAETNAMTGRNSLTLDGQPVPAGAKRGHFLLRRSDGREATAYFKSAFPDMVPVLMVDEQLVRLAPKLEWYEMAWSCFPLVLIFVGGIIGGLLGAIGSALNLRIFRSSLPVIVRYLLAAMVSICSFMLFAIISVSIHGALGR